VKNNNQRGGDVRRRTSLGWGEEERQSAKQAGSYPQNATLLSNRYQRGEPNGRGHVIEANGGRNSYQEHLRAECEGSKRPLGWTGRLTQGKGGLYRGELV